MLRQLHIVVECDDKHTGKVPRNLFETVRGMVEEANVPNAHVFWYSKGGRHMSNMN